MSFTSVLQHIGHDIAVFFKIADEAATVAEPFIVAALPPIKSIYDITLMAVTNAEAVGAASASAGKNGPQKLALVLAAITPIVNSELSKLGAPPMAQAELTKFVNAVVASVNLLPAPTGVPTPQTAAVSSIPAVAPAFPNANIVTGVR